MKKLSAVVAAAVLLVAALAFAEGAPKAAKEYQVTGKVLEVSDTMIVVEKKQGEKVEKWEINRSKDSKVTGDLKVGEKVTIMYTMTAASVEVKVEKPKAAPKAAPAPKK
jgi:hydroxyacyl-ACP dehydratase HTD2-like protein with hotdog domain